MGRLPHAFHGGNVGVQIVADLAVAELPAVRGGDQNRSNPGLPGFGDEAFEICLIVGCGIRGFRAAGLVGIVVAKLDEDKPWLGPQDSLPLGGRKAFCAHAASGLV